MNSDAVKTVAFAGAGAIVGGGAYGLIGGIGMAAGGTAIGITAGPIIAICAGVGAAGYGLVWLGKQIGRSGTKKSRKRNA